MHAEKGNPMTECSTPPSEDVRWTVLWHDDDALFGDVVTARTAWLAHQQVKGAPAFGSCRVVRVKGEE
jgi:hypothetical protein